MISLITLFVLCFFFRVTLVIGAADVLPERGEGDAADVPAHSHVPAHRHGGRPDADRPHSRGGGSHPAQHVGHGVGPGRYLSPR